MRKRTGLIFLAYLTLMFAAGCTGDQGAEDAGEPKPDSGGDIVDILDAGDTADATAQDVAPDVPPVPASTNAKVQKIQGGCNCPKDGLTTAWCAGTNGDLYIPFALSIQDHAEDDKINKIILRWIHDRPLEDGESYEGVGNETTIPLPDEDGKIKTVDDNGNPKDVEVKFDLADLEKAYKTENPDAEELPDGHYLLRVETESTLDGSAGLHKTHELITVFVDRTGPSATILGGDGFLFKGGSFAQELIVQLCGLSDQSDITGFSYKLGEQPLVPVKEEIKTGCIVPTFDIGRNKTEETVFTVILSDCVGNVAEYTYDVRIVGMPYYRLPGKMMVPKGLVEDVELGPPLKLFSVDLGSPDDWEPDLFMDLVIVMNGATAVAINDTKGGFGLPHVGLPGASSTQTEFVDVNSDGYLDLVMLVQTSVTLDVRIYLQDTLVVDQNPDEEEEEPIFVPQGTFGDATKPSESLSIPLESEMHLLRVLDANQDGFTDILVAGPKDELSAMLFLHTGKHDIPKLPPKEGEEPEPDLEQPKKFYVLWDTTPGITGTSDVVVGNFVTGDKGRPDLVFTRGESDLITTMALEDDGTFAQGKDTIYWFGGIGMALARNLGWDFDVDGNVVEVDDLLVATGHNTIHYVPAAGDGTFMICALYEDEEDPYCYALMLPADDPELDFGQIHIPNVTNLLLTNDDSPQVGDVLYLGAPADSMVMGGFDDSGFGKGDDDLAVAVPDNNFIAIFGGRNSEEYETFGKFSEAMFLNPGPSPRSLVTADFDGDSKSDLACIVGTTVDDIGIVVLLQEPSVPGNFVTAIDMPLPVSGDWQSGRLQPTHFVVAPMGGEADETNDIVVATAPEKQFWTVPNDEIFLYVDEEGEDVPHDCPEEELEKSLPLILNYSFQEGLPQRGNALDLRPRKSTVDVNMDQALSGFAVGQFDKGSGSQFLDLAVSVAGTFDSSCAGRTFDILRGGWRVAGVNNPCVVGLDDDQPLDYYEAAGPSIPGYFRPMGGYLGLKNISGLTTAYLNSDELSDLLLIAPEVGKPGDEGYQPHSVATYLTRMDNAYNECAVGTGKNEIWFTGAPFFPLAMSPPSCTADVEETPDDPDDPEEPPPEDDPLAKKCLPMPGVGTIHGPAEPSDASYQWEIGYDPIAVVAGDYLVDSIDCNDIMVASGTHDNVTYHVGVCGDNKYKFHSPEHPPIQSPIGAEPVAIVTTDLDDDGYIDVIAALAKNISIAYGKQNGEFENPWYLPLTDVVAPTSLVVEDINNDDWPDFLVTEANQDRILVFLNGGLKEAGGKTQIFGPFELPCGKDPIAIQVADMDQDGCKDIAVLNGGSRTVSILFNKRCDQ